MKKVKYYSNEVWLRRKYVTEGLTAAEIGKLCGVSEMTIVRWLNTFNIRKKFY
jgi:transposase